MEIRTKVKLFTFIVFLQLFFLVGCFERYKESDFLPDEIELTKFENESYGLVEYAQFKIEAFESINSLVEFKPALENGKKATSWHTISKAEKMDLEFLIENEWNSAYAISLLEELKRKEIYLLVSTKHGNHYPGEVGYSIYDWADYYLLDTNAGILHSISYGKFQ